jgi:nitrogen-specific signal transduction histidine kinase
LTPEECSRLFTPYYTTKLQGTGLGLAIVQSVVSDHHGAISVTSDEGRGTTFRIDFPQRQAGQPVAARQPAPESKDKSKDKSKDTPSTFAAASD